MGTRDDRGRAVQIEQLACTLWGPPNEQLSSATKLRFGRKGSKSVDLDRCIWCDHETDEGGGFVDLYRFVHGRNPDKTSCAPARVSCEVDQAEAEANAAVAYEIIAKLRAELIRPDKSCVAWYLRERGIEVAALDDIAYHRRLWHRPTGGSWPAMVALVRDVDGHVVALHRTYISRRLPPTKAPIEPNKMLLGASRGCAIHLAPAASTLLLGEGIETVASAMQIFGLPGWSVISDGGLKHVVLPDLVREVVVAADNDKAGISAAIAAAQRFRREGRRVDVQKPADCNDFNDYLLRVKP
jgi:hypothetical protein